MVKPLNPQFKHENAVRAKVIDFGLADFLHRLRGASTLERAGRPSGVSW